MAGERLEHALKRYRKRYRAGDRSERSGMLDEFCELTGYHRKYAISLLNNVNDEYPLTSENHELVDIQSAPFVSWPAYGKYPDIRGPSV